MTRILCAGLATVDVIHRVDRIPGVDEKAQATSVEIAAGGPAANAAVTAAALGAEVTLVTAVGAHPLGELIRSDLTAQGVRVVDAARERTAPPPVSAVTVLDATGERTVVSRNAGDLAVRVPEGGLPDADLTLVDGHHPALAVAAARAARRLLIDAGTWRPVFAEILPLAEVVACSAAFRHPGEAAPTDAALAAAIGPAHVIVTHGPDPVRWFAAPAGRSGSSPASPVGPSRILSDLSEISSCGGRRSGEIVVPAVRAVDTAGAGDVFHGALAVALADIPAPTHPAHPLPASHPAAVPIAGTFYPDISSLVEAIGFAIRVAGVRVVHRGPRAWLSALAARSPRID